MAFSTFGGIVTLSHSASGTRDSDGNQREDVPQTTRSVPLTAESGSARGVALLLVGQSHIPGLPPKRAEIPNPLCPTTPPAFPAHGMPSCTPP